MSGGGYEEKQILQTGSLPLRQPPARGREINYPDNQSVGRGSRQSHRNGSIGGESFNRSTSSAARSNRSGSSRKPLNLDGMSYLDQIKLLKDELQKERRRNADLER